jgi:hypothetical protein
MAINPPSSQGNRILDFRWRILDQEEPLTAFPIQNPQSTERCANKIKYNYVENRCFPRKTACFASKLLDLICATLSKMVRASVKCDCPDHLPHWEAEKATPIYKTEAIRIGLPVRVSKKRTGESDECHLSSFFVEAV